MISQLRHKVNSHFPNVAYNVVAIAASKGGLKAVSQILSALPVDFPAAIIVIQHICPQYRSYMAEILSRRTVLQVKQVEEGDLLRPGIVYTPVPNKHVVVNPNGTLSLSDAPKMNFVRPAADKLFISMAAAFKSRAIAIVLTGKDSDGILGVLAINKYDGTVIAQDEASCECFAMPKSAIETGKVDLVLPLEAISDCLLSLVKTKEAVSS